MAGEGKGGYPKGLEGGRRHMATTGCQGCSVLLHPHIFVRICFVSFQISEATNILVRLFHLKKKSEASFKQEKKGEHFCWCHFF